MKIIIIAVLALTVSATAFSQTKATTKPATDTSKVVAPAFPINETNIVSLLDMVAVFNNIMDKVPNIGLNGEQIIHYKQVMQMYRGMLTDWEEKVKNTKDAKSTKP